MHCSSAVSRRAFLQASALMTGGLLSPRFLPLWPQSQSSTQEFGEPLQEVRYGAVQFSSGPQQGQLEETHAVLMSLDEDRRGPIVLFAIGAGPIVTRQDLMSARKLSGERNEWQVDGRNGRLVLKPFTAIGEDRYSTYVNVS